ncbi:MAG: class I SAM-dependent methyltransferase [Anaerolineae bacterium]|nr:class I SAM-dependent methyltransferase [Anaerolineae bacterium]
MTDTTEYMEKMLRITDPLAAPLNRSAIQALELPLGSQGLDAGCGVGLQIPLLAEAVGSEGQVTGLDVLPEFLAQAETLAEELGLKDRVSVRQGDLNDLPFDDATFDWLWSASAAGYGADQPLDQLRELARVVRPGGTVALLIYTSQALIPGHPLLEARLNATATGIAPFTLGAPPENHWLRASGWFRAAGLREFKAQTFVRDVQAPLSDELRAALGALIEMRWDGAESEVDRETWREYERLCSPDSPDFILDTPDYYGFFTETLFHGRVASEASRA